MAIHTQQSMSGYIASDPQLSYTERGDARLYMKVGQEHYRKEVDGSFTQLDATFHDLVIYRKTAERAHARFAKGDRFVAEGYTREYDLPGAAGEKVVGEEFIAKKIGHDLARTRYAVERTRPTASDPLSTGIDDPTHDVASPQAAFSAPLGR